MAYTVDILNALKVADNGLLSKINIGGKTYEIKDLIARENIGTLSAGLDAIAADLAALAYVKGTGVYADDAAIKAAIEAGDNAMKDYVNAQVGAINKFDVHVMAEDEVLPAASAKTMYVLYLKPEQDAASGAYVEYITVKSGEEYNWEAIGSTKMDVTGFVTETALNDKLKDYQLSAELGDLAKKDEADLDLGELAHMDVAELGDLAVKDEVSGVVAGQTISGIKATGKSAGSINVTLAKKEEKGNVTGKFTPAGTVTGTAVTDGEIEVTLTHAGTAAALSKGDYTPAGTVSADFSYASTAAELVKGDVTPTGTVSVALSGGSFNAITGVGSQASFTEGKFTPASLDSTDVTANYATEGIVGAVADECLTFTAAGIAAITATKVNEFVGGSKAADTFVANGLPTMAAHEVGVQSASFKGNAHEIITGVKYDKAALGDLAFAGTKAEGLAVTGVTYEKAAIGTQTFTGKTVDIKAEFAGTEGDIEGQADIFAYDIQNKTFIPGDIELSVGDIAIAEKTVTSK